MKHEMATLIAPYKKSISNKLKELEDQNKAVIDSLIQSYKFEESRNAELSKEIIDLEKIILELKKENNLMSVNISYIKRPENLKLINSRNFNLLPIKTNHISNLEFYE